MTHTFCTASENFTILRSIPNFQADCLIEGDTSDESTLSCVCCTKCCRIVDNNSGGSGGGGVDTSEVVCEPNFMIDDSDGQNEVSGGDGSAGEAATTVVQLNGTP